MSAKKTNAEKMEHAITAFSKISNAIRSRIAWLFKEEIQSDMVIEWTKKLDEWDSANQAKNGGYMWKIVHETRVMYARHSYKYAQHQFKGFLQWSPYKGIITELAALGVALEIEQPKSAEVFKRAVSLLNTSHKVRILERSLSKLKNSIKSFKKAFPFGEIAPAEHLFLQACNVNLDPVKRLKNNEEAWTWVNEAWKRAKNSSFIEAEKHLNNSMEFSANGSPPGRIDLEREKLLARTLANRPG